ncbi:MAG: hypothetical protein Alpg2KO_05960 [Alphaproteobacteria bacterium]
MADRPDSSDLPARFLGEPIVRRRVTMPPLEERARVRSEATTARAKFIKWLASDHHKKLKKIGLSDRAIQKMADTGYVPSGFHVHHKLPVGVGGSNDFENLVLMDANHHAELHRFIDPYLYGMQTGEIRVVPLVEATGPIHMYKPTATRRHAIDMTSGWRSEMKAQAGKTSRSRLSCKNRAGTPGASM